MERAAAQHLAQPTAQTVAGHCSLLESWNDDSQPRVARLVCTPGQVETRGPQLPAFFPAGGEFRAAAETRAARQPLARA